MPIRQVEIHSRDYVNPTLLSLCSINNHNEPNNQQQNRKHIFIVTRILILWISSSSSSSSSISPFCFCSYLLPKKNYDHYIPIQRTQPNTIKEIYEKTLSSVMRILIKVAPTGVPRGADSHLSRGCRTGCRQTSVRQEGSCWELDGNFVRGRYW